MELKLSNKNFISKIMASLTLSMFFITTPVFADGALFNFEPIKAPAIKLINPNNSDIFQTDKTVNDTIIPFHLRGNFDEADYFSSNVDDTPPTKPPPSVDFADIPTPSEFKNVNSIVNQESEIQTLKEFKPLENTQEANFAVQNEEEQIKNIQPFEIIDETTYTASLDSYADVDLNGKRISKIRIYGLKTIEPNIVLSKINSQQGTLYNDDILQKDLQNIYSTGYFSDNMSIEPILNPDDTVELTFVVEENILITDISIVGNNVVSTEELMPLVSVLKNKPQNLNNINDVIDNIQKYYHQKGYTIANVHSVDDNSEGNLIFTIWEGVINKIEILGNERTKDYVIKRNIMTQPGSVYNEEFLKKDLAKVFSTQIFDEVNRDIKPSEENVGTYDVAVIVTEKTTNSVGFGGGIDTGLGAFGSISLKEDNFLGKAQKLSLTGIIGSGILLNDASIKNHMNFKQN